MKLGLSLKLLGRERLRDLMRIVMINIYDVMNEHFSHSALKERYCPGCRHWHQHGSTVAQHRLQLLASGDR
jgi:hypothetical protein